MRAPPPMRVVIEHERAIVVARDDLPRARFARVLLDALVAFYRDLQKVGRTPNDDEADLYIAVVEWLYWVTESEQWS